MEEEIRKQAVQRHLAGESPKAICQGTHGTCRHSYVQERVATIQQLGYTYAEALKITSQECGHFMSSIISDFYLR